MTKYLDGKTNAEYINPAILDWLTLIIQDTGQVDYLTYAATIPQWQDAAAIADSGSIRYIATRRPIPPKSSSTTSNDYVTGTSTSLSEATVISNFTAALDEQLFSNLNLNGRIRGVITVGLTSSTTVAAYLSNVIVSIYKSNASGVKTLLGSDTVNMAVSNATATEVLYTIPFMMSSSGIVDKEDIFYIQISTTGYVASAATVTHKIYMTRGTASSYCEVQI